MDLLQAEVGCSCLFGSTFTVHQPYPMNYSVCRSVLITLFTAFAFLACGVRSVGQTTISVSVKNTSGCDVKVGPNSATACTGALTSLGSATVPSGQNQVCQFTMPAGHTLCTVELSRSPYPPGAQIITLDCTTGITLTNTNICNTGMNNISIENNRCGYITIWVP